MPIVSIHISCELWLAHRSEQPCCGGVFFDIGLTLVYKCTSEIYMLFLAVALYGFVVVELYLSTPTRYAHNTSENQTTRQRQQLAQQHLLWQRLQETAQLQLSQA